MPEKLTEYEIQKAKNKRLLVRNELETVGKYQIPLITTKYVFKAHSKFCCEPLYRVSKN